MQRVMNRAQTEIKGMLIQNMERGVYDSESPFHRSLANGSPVFKEVMEENLKEKPYVGSPSFTRSPSTIKLEDIFGRAGSHTRLNSIPSERQSIAEGTPEKTERNEGLQRNERKGKSVIKLRAVEGGDSEVFS